MSSTAIPVPGNFNFGLFNNTSENQYGSGYPTIPFSNNMMPSMSGAPGSVPMPSGGPYANTNPTAQNTPSSLAPGLNWTLAGNQLEVPTTDPALTSDLMGWLQTQVGTGLTPYGLSASLPTGGATAPGQVASPLDPATKQLMDFFTSGQSTNPNLQSLGQLAQTGDPIDQLPAWQAMVAAAQHQIDEGGANVREQFSFTGNLPGSSGATALSDYYENANLGLTSQLINAQTQAQQQAVQNRLAASQVLQSGEQSLGSSLYGYDQNAINALMQEYFQTTPQENPLNSELFSGATTFPPTYGKTSSPGIFGSIIGAAGSILGGAAGAGKLFGI
jgi:hypothetical protein